MLRMKVNKTVRAYYSLMKPGVLYGNVITAAAGFFLASKGTVDVPLFIAMIIGTTLVIGSACAINNYLDQDIDKLMSRTKKRALITGEVSPRGALIFGILIGLLGILVLALFTNWLVVVIGIIGFIDYVWLYGALTKRRSIHGTLVGSVSGAIPILAGYVAVSNQIDIGAVLVFAVLFFWQMPEFYSIAIYRRKEYKAAGVPVISVVKGVEHTKQMIFVYTALFVMSTILLTTANVTGITYFVTMAVLGMYWLWMAVKGLKAEDSDAWARRMFHFSLIILLVFCFMISVDSFLP